MNCSPAELARLLAAGSRDSAGGASEGAASPAAEGAQVKVNLLLRRLPRLKDAALAPEAAFGGTFHINETFRQLQAAYDAAAAGRVPDPLPAEIYCHSLTDPSILGPELRASGAQTLTVFALHAPDRLVTEATNDAMRQTLQAAVLSSLDSVLAEPVESLLLTDANGDPCIETKTTRDLEHALRLPGGSIFHGDLSWPWLEDDAPTGTPARALGGRHGARGHPLLRIGRAARRRRQRDRRPQRGDGRARGARGALAASGCPTRAALSPAHGCRSRRVSGSCRDEPSGSATRCRRRHSRENHRCERPPNPR